MAIEYDFIFNMVVLGMVSGIVLYAINRLNPAKKGQKSGHDGVKDLYSVYSEQVKDILKLKDNHIKRLNAEINQYAGDNEEEIEQPAKYEDLKALAKEAGVNPLILEMPFVKNQIKKYTKGMTIEEIISTVKELKGFIGNKNLNQQLIHLHKIAPTTSNLIEKIDDQTYKQICSQCGGKGFYLHQNYNLTLNKIDKSEIVSCQLCESGFIYGNRASG